MAAVTCACGEAGGTDATFCEACGARLDGGPAAQPAATGGRACPVCQAANAVGADGYCTTCGMLIRRERDHVEVDASDPGPAGVAAAAVTDRGVRHHRNEDAVWLTRTPDQRQPCLTVVVADGVSSSYDPDVASAVAVESAGAMLDAAAAGGAESDLEGLLSRAITAAGTAVADLAHTGDPRRAASSPACTIVAAAVRAGAVSYGWVGDSRAYWLPDNGTATQLTMDDSWAAEAVRQGVDPQEARRDTRAHAITAWLGADAGPVRPRTGRLAITGPGTLLVCSDGLWNYLPDSELLTATVRAHAEQAAGEPSPMLALARSLTRFAVDAGGHDNITVAVVRIDV